MRHRNESKIIKQDEGNNQLQVKVLALLSGGLDSTLAVKIAQNLCLNIEAVHFTTPFCICDKCALEAVSDRFEIPVHHIFLGEEFIDLLIDPPHGYGSRMNICIDCRILMFKKATKLADSIGAEYILTGEVLDERPFSQRISTIQLIEKEAGLEGRVLRPLSGRILPKTDLEREGLIKRKDFYAIKGRSRKPQMRLAEELDIGDYPCPSGGCLLTDPHFANRIKTYMAHEGRPSLQEIALLKVGRHFRCGKARVIVGRNEKENQFLKAIANKIGIPYMSALHYVGPITLIMGDTDDETIQKSAAITVRYSDAPSNLSVDVIYSGTSETPLSVKAFNVGDLDKLRI